MKICLIVDDYLPNSIKVAAKMMHELALEFKENGYEVTVITPDTNIDKNMIIDNLDGITVLRFKSGQIKNVSKIKRAINESLLSYKTWKYCKNYLINNYHDLIVYYSPTIFFGPLVSKLKKLWNARSYLILRDLFPQWTIDNGLLKENSLITKYFKYFELMNYKSADKIGLMSEKNLEWFDKKFNNRFETEVLYNWASLNKNENFNINIRKKLNIEDKVIYFYGGNMGHAQDMMNLLKLASNMKPYNEAHFLFVGAGDEVDIMNNYIEKNNLTNVSLLPSVNQVEFKEILFQIDVGLFTLNKNHITHNFPGKLLGYMCESKPILGSINPENDLKKVIEDANAGLITINGEDSILLENAIKLLDNPYREELGSNSFKLLNSKFSVKSAVSQILENIYK